MSRSLEARTYSFVDDNGKVRYSYDIVDLDDTVIFQGKELPELVAEPNQSWAKEESARERAVKHIEELLND
jgi:hypothetical protein